jgi:hypothetical protein
MKVLVCGSRTWESARIIDERLRQLPRGTTIIVGGARGADRLSAMIARGLGFEVIEFPANWRPDGVYNPRAGVERNLRMLDEDPDLVIAFWEGGSTGTKHTITEANRRGITVEVYAPNDDRVTSLAMCDC